MKTKTVGQASYDLLQKPPEKINVIDMQREMQKSALREIEEIINTHRDYADKYYIVYMLIKDRVIPNLIKQKFIARKSRPFPDYDCSLFSYDNRKSEFLFHWAIPDEKSCEYILHPSNDLNQEEKELFKYVSKFADGKLI